MQLSDEELRELEAANQFGKRRTRFWMRATIVSIAATLVLVAILVKVDVIGVTDKYGDLNAWIIMGPILFGGVVGAALKQWYTPILVRKIAREYDVTEESLDLAKVDISGGSDSGFGF